MEQHLVHLVDGHILGRCSQACDAVEVALRSKIPTLRAAAMDSILELLRGAEPIDQHRRFALGKLLRAAEATFPPKEEDENIDLPQDYSKLRKLALRDSNSSGENPLQFTTISASECDRILQNHLLLFADQRLSERNLPVVVARPPPVTQVEGKWMLVSRKLKGKALALEENPLLGLTIGRVLGYISCQLGLDCCMLKFSMLDNGAEHLLLHDFQLLALDASPASRGHKIKKTISLPARDTKAWSLMMIGLRWGAGPLHREEAEIIAGVLQDT